MLGRVANYDSKKCHGFIDGDDGRKYFVHESEIRLPSKSLYAGYTVIFTPKLTEKGWQAADVKLY